MTTVRIRPTMVLGICVATSLFAAPMSRANDLEKNIPSESALKTKMALKLAGLVTFAAGACPSLRADYARFKSAIRSLGVNYEDLDKTAMKATYLGYAMRYKDDPKENCTRALANFGPGGKTIPDIFAIEKAP